ncbi:MAG: TonB-dependent receptor [Candidatus Didemnitutus sp.]|nr:TonB-dependent receptor [Candidatus Didemnitutus sp.]
MNTPVLLRAVAPLWRQLLCCFALVSSATCFAQAAAPTAFDLPAGEAGQTLKQFAHQAKREILFSVQLVDGVKTNAVHGELAAREALDRMLAGTELAALEDAKTGAFTIRRDPKSEPPKEKPAFTPAPRTETGAAALRDDGGVVTLSPFLVVTEKDDGFVAANSLAGGRMSLPLRDTPLAYSVITRDFLDALSLDSQEAALSWSVGSYMPITPLSAYRYNDGEAGSSVVSRGLWITQAQRNFFLLGQNSDTYSQERFDFARGPNALLIGTGSLGGVVSGMTKRARVDTDFNKMSLQTGSWGRARLTLDVNRRAGERFAIRVNALLQDSPTWRDLEFDNRQGIHLAATYRLLKNTTLRAEYEHYKQSTLLGRETMSESISGWDGVTTVAAPVASITNSDAKGLARLGSSTSPYLLYVPGMDSGTVMNWANTWRTQGGAANAAVPVGGKLALSTANLSINGGSMIDSIYSPDLLFGLAEAGSSFRRPSTKTVIQPDMPTLEYGFHDAAVFLEHHQGQHLFLEAAFNYADTDKHVETAASRMGNATIDVNQTLPNGQPNPNFKKVYSEALASSFYYKTKVGEGRAALALVFDDTKWGDFRANVITGRRKVNYDLYAYTSVMDRNPDIRRRSVDDIFTYRFYWDNLRQPGLYPDSVQYVDPIAGTTQTYHVSKIVDLRSIGTLRAADSNFDYVQSAFTAKLFKGRLNLIGGIRRDRVKQLSYSGNSTNNSMADYPVDWDGQTIYYRPVGPADYYTLQYQAKDSAGNITGNGAYLPANSRPRDANFKPLPQYANDRFRDDYSQPAVDVSATTVTYGGVFHALSWISAYANYAESFKAPGAGVTLTGQPMPVTTSEGWDAGLRFNLLGGRISASVGRYVGKQFDSQSQISNAGKYANIVNANKVGDQNPNGMNTRGLAAIPAIAFDFKDDKTEGYEIDITANLTRNWRLTANAGIPKVYNLNGHKDEFAYLAANEATLKQIVLDAGVLIDASNVATVDTSIPVANRSPDAAAAATAWNDIQTFKATNSATVVTGSDLPRFTANVYTDYRIPRGFLKNLRVGGGIQYIGRTAIGNRGADTIVNPANPLTAIDDPSVDSSTRIYRAAYYTVTLTANYQMKLRHDMLLDLNLRVGNALGNNDLVYVGAALRPPGGDISRPDRVSIPTTFVYQQPRSYALTATLTF